MLSCRAGPNGRVRYHFADSQPWCRTSLKRLKIIDETLELESLYEQYIESDGEDDNGTESPQQWRSRARSRLARSLSPHSQAVESSSEDGTSNSRVVINPSIPEALPFTPPSIELDESYPVSDTGCSSEPPASLREGRPEKRRQERIDQDISGDLNNVWETETETPPSILTLDFTSPLYFEPSNFPLRDRHQAELMRHFTSHIAPLLDVYDPSRTFSTSLPQMAAACPMLLEAVFAVSAGHSAQIQGLDYTVDSRSTENYYQRCVRRLQPALEHVGALGEPLATAVALLRFFERAHGGTTENDTILMSIIPVLLHSQASSILRGGTDLPSFWLLLQQETYDAIMNQGPLKLDLDNDLFLAIKCSSEFSWARRMTVHLATVVQFCFGGDTNLKTYQQLVEFTQLWLDSGQVSLMSPLFDQPQRGDSIFPEIHVVGLDDAVVELQYYHLIKLLLSAHNPTLPRLGKKMRDTARAIDVSVLILPSSSELLSWR